ncbi:hypothetical protein CAEBREN_01973 [Caenorhabditis brenneri]|uniref:Uncharacterized protein n=1 Tax=Caenorhabditis brenneri TaxID=135651 RepID=G0MLQ5_CAEBE|nr:hypothetical protein CAEBREN_01973 [Caenorhabditis brenneri]
MSSSNITKVNTLNVTHIPFPNTNVRQLEATRAEPTRLDYANNFVTCGFRHSQPLLERFLSLLTSATCFVAAVTISIGFSMIHPLLCPLDFHSINT